MAIEMFETFTSREHERENRLTKKEEKIIDSGYIS